MTSTPSPSVKESPPCVFRFKSRRLQTRLKKVIKKTGLSISDCLNQAIEDFCKKHENLLENDGTSQT